jgi:hypothetical protein
MMMASAYACAANFNMYNFMGDVAQNPTALAPSGMWGFLANEFPSTTGSDDYAEGAQAAEDALLSVIDPGTVVLANETFDNNDIGSNIFNPEAYQVGTRTVASNAYLFFVSMAAIGAIGSRYDKPTASGSGSTATYHPSSSPPFPWVTAATVTPDGCAYASAVLNFVDSLGALAGSVPGSLGSSILSLQSTFKNGITVAPGVTIGIGSACSDGCTGAAIAPIAGTGCALSSCSNADSIGCPLTLRNRASCTGQANDSNSCAAAGIINFVVNQIWQ